MLHVVGHCNVAAAMAVMGSLWHWLQHANRHPPAAGRIHQKRTLLHPPQVNAALGDLPTTDKLEYSLRQEMEQVVTVGARVAGAMIK